MVTNIFLGLLLIGVVFIIFKKKNPSDDRKIIEENARLKADLDQKNQSIGEIRSELEKEKTEKNQLSGKDEQSSEQITALKAENRNISTEKERLVKEISNFNATEGTRAKEFHNNIQKLDEAKLVLEDERQRIRREDEERLQREKDERHRMWVGHEENVKVQLTELCKLPQYGFDFYDNTNLPAGFGGKFKPDFLIEFMGQFIIFDAKASEANLQNYINENVKLTVGKINNDPKIFKTVFFIVPIDDMKSLKKIRFYEQSYDFFVIPPQAMEIVLASFKKLKTYEQIEQLDPRDRENIVNLIAEFDHHINMRNALDILASTSGIAVLKKVETLQEDIKKDIREKKDKIRPQNFTPTEIKTLMVGIEAQSERISGLISPKVDISEDYLKTIKPLLGKKK